MITERTFKAQGVGVAAAPEPLVTIVTPTFNQLKFLAASIESVLNQDYPNIEYVVIDDGSTDATSEIMFRYADRARIVRQSNSGQAKTLNRGWASANGKYLAYLSSDDILTPSCIREMVSTLEADTGIVCAFPNADLIDANGNTIKRKVCRPFSLVDTIVENECFIGPGAVFRKAAFDLVGGWREDIKLAPDREFWTRLARLGKFHFHEEALAQYRFHAQSLSSRETSDHVTQEYLKVLDLYYADDPAPECLLRKNEAYGHAYLVLARNSFRSGRFGDGIKYYRAACRSHAPFSSFSVKLQLIRHTISRPIRFAFGNFRQFGWFD